MRPCHDGRHTSITNGAASGRNPYGLMNDAGHSDFKTTQLYINLSGQVFRDDAELAEERLLGKTGTKNRYQVEEPSPVEATVE
jgi:hypothetical protein